MIRMEACLILYVFDLFIVIKGTKCIFHSKKTDNNYPFQRFCFKINLTLARVDNMRLLKFWVVSGNVIRIAVRS